MELLTKVYTTWTEYEVGVVNKSTTRSELSSGDFILIHLISWKELQIFTRSWREKKKDHKSPLKKLMPPHHAQGCLFSCHHHRVVRIQPSASLFPRPRYGISCPHWQWQNSDNHHEKVEKTEETIAQNKHISLKKKSAETL